MKGPDKVSTAEPVPCRDAILHDEGVPHGATWNCKDLHHEVEAPAAPGLKEHHIPVDIPEGMDCQRLSPDQPRAKDQRKYVAKKVTWSPAGPTQNPWVEGAGQTSCHSRRKGLTEAGPGPTRNKTTPHIESLN